VVPLALLVLAGIGVLVAAACTGRLPWRLGPQAADRQVPPGALEEYVPADSAAVIQVNLGPMLASPAARKHLE
jgi:hypothetical protein